jgi:hypothetical protein
MTEKKNNPNTPTYVVGYKFKNKQGFEAEVVAYRGRKDIDIMFSDGAFVKGTTGSYIKKGLPMHPTHGKITVGRVYQCKNGDVIEVLEYVDALNVKVKWLSDGYEKWILAEIINKGIIKHPLTNKVNRGGVYKTNNCGYVTVLEDNGYDDVIVQFECGEVKKVSKYNLFRGSVAKEFKSRSVSIDQEFTSNTGWVFRVIEYNGWDRVKVEWQDGSISEEAAGDIVKGSVLCLNQPNAQGVGFWGYGKYPPRNHLLKSGQVYPDDRVVGYWSRMISRCYNEKEQAKPSCSAYIGCTVSKEWHNFQNFCEWAETKEQSKFKDEAGNIWTLDKDLLVKGNRVYGEKCCTFLPNEVNVFLSDKPKGSLPRGVNYIKPATKRSKEGYVARCHLNGVREYLGYYETPMEAFYNYKEAKEFYAKELANKYKDQLESKAYEALMLFEVEPYD